jgi:hypothetical protein
MSGDNELRRYEIHPDSRASVWLRMQVRYDLEVAQGLLSDRTNREVKVFQRPVSRV